ncbi:hypothetical protein BG003_002137 [Podila horticola]|nr:hypothetical protein BG003_002137 [Podila horticola]
MICLCMTGESISQSVICPFLYYMVRDFHVGIDIWIGYYAGLLLTGYWGANLCTTLLWGHLSDKYGRKAVLLFGLFMTSLSTIYLGLATCYHDAMWALVFQGACTGLVPVSKCAIGEIANRQQRIYDAQIAALPRHRHHHRRRQRPSHPPPSYESYEQQDYLDNEKGGIDGEWRVACSSPECDGEAMRERQLQPREDYAAKGYSALVIAVAIGAALGPLVGGSLTKKQIPGFEKYTYLAPCLLAAGVGLLVTCLVALILNETNPKWAKPLPQLLEPSRESHYADTARRASATTATTTRRGRPGYEQSRRFLSEEVVLNNVSSNSNSSGRQCEEEGEVDYGSGVGSSGSEFVMLYTQSPVARGGLDFSAKVLGQVLTMRGILKLTFNLFGYPFMVRRLGLIHCLRLGIAVIGMVSVLGMGWAVPWSVERERDSVGGKGGASAWTATGTNRSTAESGSDISSSNASDLQLPSQHQQQQSGSGVLWSVAQVSANVMRLTGPVLAG